MNLGELIEKAMTDRGWNADRLAREVSAAAVASGYPGHTVTGQSVRGWIKRGAIPEKVRLMLLIDVLDLPRDQINLDATVVRDYRSGPVSEYPTPDDAARVAELERKVAELEALVHQLVTAAPPDAVPTPEPARRATPARRG